MALRTGQQPVVRSFQDFSNIARSRADASLHVDSATGQVRVSAPRNPFQRVITWVRGKLGLPAQAATGQVGKEEVRAAYNRFLRAVSEEQRYKEQLPSLEDALAPDIMADDPEPLTTRKIRKITADLEERVSHGAETRYQASNRATANYLAGREGSNSLNNMLEDGIDNHPALERANFTLAGAEVDRLAAAIYDAIMAKSHADRQQLSPQTARGIAERLVGETLDRHEARLVGGATSAAPASDTASVSVPAGANATGPDAAEPPLVARQRQLPDQPAATVTTPAETTAVTTAATASTPGSVPAPASDTVQTTAQIPGENGAVNQSSGRERRVDASEPLRRSFVRKTMDGLSGRRKTFNAPLSGASGREPDAGATSVRAGNEAPATAGGEIRAPQQAVDVPVAPVAARQGGPEQTARPPGRTGQAEQTGAAEQMEQTKPGGLARRLSMRLALGSAGRRSSRLADGARAALRKDAGRQPVVIDKQRLSNYLRDIDLPRDVRAGVKILVKDGSVRNYPELFRAVNKATFDWARENRMQGWYGEALKGQGIRVPRGKGGELPAELLDYLRTNIVKDREALDYPGFKQQARLLIGQYVLGQTQ